MSEWSGLVCEFYLDGILVRGDVRDLSHAGFFVETTARLEVGHELELRLTGGATSHPVYIRGVVESLKEQASRGAESQPVVRFRLLRYSQDYSVLITGTRATGQAIRASRSRPRSPRREDEREWLSEIMESGTKESSNRSTREREAPEWDDYEPLLARAGIPLWSEDSLAPEAIVIDDGELDDVANVLAELGIKAERQSPEGESFPLSWIPPRHLLVVSAKRALKLRLPPRSESCSFVAIAVADSDARTVCSAVRRLGYQYVVSRPIHPFALSMLLRQAIYPDHDNRIVSRAVVGCSVRWRCGWQRSRSGVILDMSLGGCQVFVEAGPPRGSRIKIRVPGRAVDGRAFTLVGRVIRVSRGDRGTTLGVSFEYLGASAQRRLQGMLSRPAPYRLAESALLPEVSGPEPKASQWERRRKFRAAVSQEVVALGHGSADVKHVLVSRDLSMDGMRVEAHPSLVLGEQLDLALYEEPQGAPLVLAAVVARDDERLGWWLRFVGLVPEAEARLKAVLDRFPPVTRLDREGADTRVVLGQMLEAPDAGEEGAVD